MCCVQGEVGVASEEGGITDIGRKRLDFRGSFGEGKKAGWVAVGGGTKMTLPDSLPAQGIPLRTKE